MRILSSRYCPGGRLKRFLWLADWNSFPCLVFREWPLAMTWWIRSSAALESNDLSLEVGDVLVLAQKIVSKAENRYVRLA